MYAAAQNKQDNLDKAIKLIEGDYTSGRINYEESLLQKFYSAFDKSKSLYKTTASGSFSKCGTELVKEYRQNRGKLSASAISEIESYLNRPFQKTATSLTYISPSGKFELTYDTTGANAVPSADTDNDGVPDYVEWVASYFDYSWAYTIDTLGYLAIPIGTGRYQVGFEDMEYYGYTDVENDAKRITHIVMENDFKGFSSNNDPEGKQKGAAKVTAVHEFKHATQFVYTKWSDPSWLLEMDATWMEDIGYDYVNDYYNYLSASHLTDPTRAFADGKGYEDCIFMHYISQKNGIPANRKIWERRKTYSSETVFTTFDKVLAAYSSSFADALREYFAWNYATGSRAKGPFPTYEEASAYPTSVICLDKSVLPDSSSGCNLNPTGGAFLRYQSNNEDTYFNIKLSAASAGPYGMDVLIAYADGSSERLSAVPDSTNIDYTVQKSLKNINYFVVIPVVIASTGNERSYSCKVSSLSGPVFSLTPVKDTETPSAKTIIVTVSDEYLVGVPDSLKLYYNINNSGYHFVKLIPTGNNSEYSSVIPDAVSGSTITYYISEYNIFSQYYYYPAGGSSSPFKYYMGADIVPPVIAHNQRSILSKYDFPLYLYADVSDNIGVASVNIEYSLNGGNTSVLQMTKVKDGLYSASINPESTGTLTRLSYKIIASDSSSNKNKAYFPADGSINLTLTQGIVYSSSLKKDIRDVYVLGLKDTITVDQDLDIADVDIALNITHPRISDLIVKILPPFAKTGMLVNKPGYGTSLANTANPDIIFDQDAYYNITDFAPDDANNLTGRFKPDTLNLNTYRGNNAKGKWILIVSDNYSSETGTLNNWKLIFNTGGVVSVDNESVKTVTDYNLMQNYPNPFNPSTIISYSLPSESFVELKVFDILGREVSTLVNGLQKAGTYKVNFNAENLSSGVYFYRIKTDNFSSVKKMTFIQ
jgi:subtilisin-like proprotein convertase family protein